MYTNQFFDKLYLREVGSRDCGYRELYDALAIIAAAEGKYIFFKIPSEIRETVEAIDINADIADQYCQCSPEVICIVSTLCSHSVDVIFFFFEKTNVRNITFNLTLRICNFSSCSCSKA